jgi:methylmalonyl-CoA mutase
MESPAPTLTAAPASSFTTRNKVRVVTAASLFDGHDAAIHVMRRVLQQEGAEVIHLGHNRSVEEIVEAAIQEDAQAVAISSYQGGHMEFFQYVVQLLRERGCGHVKVFGGGGGTITDAEIQELQRAGVERIYSVEDGRMMGLVGMIRDLLTRADFPLVRAGEALPAELFTGMPHAVARAISQVEDAHGRGDEAALEKFRAALRAGTGAHAAPVLGITGTGGAGKSSLTDELLRRLLDAFPERRVAILSVDPSRRKTGGALLGDRIRMNAVRGPRAFMRSMATRRAHLATAAAVQDALRVLQAAGNDLVILETAGIGQSDSEAVDLADVALYVMTPEYGAPTQLEKIAMLDYADAVAINKSDKRGAQDAQRDVRKQLQRNRGSFDLPVESMPVFLTAASRFGDAGVDALFGFLMQEIGARSGRDWVPPPPPPRATDLPVVVPAQRTRYLAEITEAVRGHKQRVAQTTELAARADGLARALREFGETLPALDQDYPPAALVDAGADRSVLVLRQRYQELLRELPLALRAELSAWPATVAAYAADTFGYTVRGQELRVPAQHETLSGLKVPKVALPQTKDWGELTRWLGLENLPGAFPYTAGVFPFKRTAEDPTRMFAGEGTAERTNRRFHFVSRGQPAIRLSTAFDSTTLYGEDPATRPDIWGKVGNAGVSICSLDDAKRLYSGFDLCSAKTSVSMTINGPAPIILAFFLNAAIDQQVEKRLKATGRWASAQQKIKEAWGGKPPPYRAERPEGHDGFGLGTLGISGDRLLPKEEYEEIRAAALRSVRGTVQADILKEDQAQNTCIFSTEFALKLMGDVQQYFVDENVRNFYSVSISGYHIAEAGANPITQLAFTLANGFTFVEYYRARGMKVDDFAPNLSFFFSNGMDAEYAVIGRVARRIWAVALRDLYGGDERSQKLKYHIQTSGRSLHAQEIDFNDIRTTLQAWYALADNCQSLHTNAFDEAITTPTEESVRRALAIQLIINRELGLAKNENPLQGAFIAELLTELVEEAVLEEFLRLDARGGVLGAMELMYQRGKIQDESLKYETLKHTGELPIVGVNTFLNPHSEAGKVTQTALIRSTEQEKQDQVDQVAALHAHHGAEAETALTRLRQAALANRNVFAELMEAAKVCTLGQISHALYGVGGQYRRNV